MKVGLKGYLLHGHVSCFPDDLSVISSKKKNNNNNHHH